MKIKDPYKDNWEETRNKKQAVCEHKHWSKTCAHCGYVFDSDKLHEDIQVKEILIDSE